MCRLLDLWVSVVGASMPSQPLSISAGSGASVRYSYLSPFVGSLVSCRPANSLYLLPSPERSACWISGVSLWWTPRCFPRRLQKTQKTMAITNSPAAAAPTPIPAFAPVESPEGDELVVGVLESSEVDDVGVGVAGAFQRAISVLCHAIWIVGTYSSSGQNVYTVLSCRYVMLASGIL